MINIPAEWELAKAMSQDKPGCGKCAECSCMTAQPEPKPYAFTPVPGAVCSQEIWAVGKGACPVHGLTGCGAPTV